MPTKTRYSVRALAKRAARSKPRWRLSRADRAWLAGFIDGEGCFHAAQGRERQRPALQFHVGNCDRVVIEHVARLLNLSNVRVTNQGRAGWRPRWSVTLCGASKILALLDLIEPFLVSKRREARVFRRLAETFPGVATRYDLPDSVKARRVRLIASLRRDRRGFGKGPPPKK